MQKVSIEELRKMLNTGTVSFVYTKKDGSTREATGTTHLDSIPEGDHPKGTGKTNEDMVNYFDTDKQGWRSFHKDSFQHVTNFVPAGPSNLI